MVVYNTAWISGVENKTHGIASRLRSPNFDKHFLTADPFAYKIQTFVDAAWYASEDTKLKTQHESTIINYSSSHLAITKWRNSVFLFGI